VYRIVARARFALHHVKNRGPRAALLEDEAGKMCMKLWRELDLHFKIAKTEGVGAFLEDEVGKVH
jgi:hypothetical protein